MITIRQRQNRERTLSSKTRDFDSFEQLTDYLVTHLYHLYDSVDTSNFDNPENDYSLGGIDTTQHYLLKCGVEFMDYEEYLELVTAEWKRV